MSLPGEDNARAILDELLAHDDGSRGIRRAVIRGNSHMLRAQTIAEALQNPSPLPLVNVTGPPKAYTLCFRGQIQQPATTPAQTYAAACFEVRWGCSGLFYSTEVDAFSDQFLSVYAEEVNVIGRWDTFNLTRAAGAGQPLLPPQALTIAAAAIESDGGIARAHRSFILNANPGPLDNFVPVPYSAHGVIIRAGTTAATSYYGGLGFFQVAGATTIIDAYSAAAVAAAHDRGEYLSVPSMSDLMSVTLNGAAPSPILGLAEFELQP